MIMVSYFQRAFLFSFAFALIPGVVFSTTPLRGDSQPHGKNLDATCAVCIDSYQCCGDLMCLQHRCVGNKDQLKFCEGNLPCEPCESVFDCSYGLCIHGFCVRSRDSQSECDTEKHISAENVKEDLSRFFRSRMQSMSANSDSRGKDSSMRGKHDNNGDFTEKITFSKKQKGVGGNAQKFGKSELVKDNFVYGQRTACINEYDDNNGGIKKSSGCDKADKRGLTVRGTSGDYGMALDREDFSAREDAASRGVPADASSLELDSSEAPYWDGVEGISAEGEGRNTSPPDWDGTEGVMNSDSSRVEVTTEANDFEDDDGSEESGHEDIKELTELLQLFDVDRKIIENLDNGGSDWKKEDENLVETTAHRDDISVRGASCKTVFSSWDEDSL